MRRTKRIDVIRAALKKHGKLTVVQISEITGISINNIGALMCDFRKKPGRKMKIRKAGKTREGDVKLSYLFELSNEPDDEGCRERPPSAVKKIKYAGMDRDEIEHQKRLIALAAEIQPFRHWQDAVLFGEARP